MLKKAQLNIQKKLKPMETNGHNLVINDLKIEDTICLNIYQGKKQISYGLQPNLGNDNPISTTY